MWISFWGLLIFYYCCGRITNTCLHFYFIVTRLTCSLELVFIYLFIFNNLVILTILMNACIQLNLLLESLSFVDIGFCVLGLILAE